MAVFYLLHKAKGMDIKMKLINFQDIKKLNISPKQCYEWTDEMIRNKNNTVLPPKISLKPVDGAFINVMPCLLKDILNGKNSWGGSKIVTRYPNRQPILDSMLFLFDAQTGECLSLMDANWITAMRTGAVAAHSIHLLAKSNFSNIAVLGLGNTARAALLVLSEIMPEREFYFKLLKYKGQELIFEERFQKIKNFHFTYTDSYEELIKGADVVLSCVTYFEDDICDNNCFGEGVLVVPIHTRGFSNCDLFFDKITADDYGHVHHFKNFDKFKYFAEVADIVNGKAKGRENDKERILAYNIGLAIHDINFAAHIYDLLKDNEDLEQIDLKAPNSKFWI